MTALAPNFLGQCPRQLARRHSGRVPDPIRVHGHKMADDSRGCRYVFIEWSKQSTHVYMQVSVLVFRGSVYNLSYRSCSQNLAIIVIVALVATAYGELSQPSFCMSMRKLDRDETHVPPTPAPAGQVCSSRSHVNIILSIFC